MFPTPYTNTTPAQCPVCKSVLGRKEEHTIFAAHCEECRATFYWKPWSEKPSVILDKDVPKRCGCGRCKA